MTNATKIKPPANAKADSSPRCAVSTGWPGLVFWLGGVVFRTLGYFAMVLCGVGVSRVDSLFVVIGELAIGHVLICAAEVVDKMNEERKRSLAKAAVRDAAGGFHTQRGDCPRSL